MLIQKEVSMVQDKEYYRKWREKNRERENARIRKWYMENKDRKTMSAKKYRDKIRMTALKLYGNKCTCCGETEPKFLSFDHVNGGGRKLRIKSKLKSTMYYRWLIDNKPNDIQILCHNCNQAKGFYGICPHRTMIE